MKRTSTRRQLSSTLLASVTLLPLIGCQMFGYRVQSPIALQAPIEAVKDTRIGPGKMTADGIQSEVMSFTDTFSGSVAQRWNEAAAFRAEPSAKDPEAPNAPGIF